MTELTGDITDTLLNVCPKCGSDESPDNLALCDSCIEAEMEQAKRAMRAFLERHNIPAERTWP